MAVAGGAMLAFAALIPLWRANRPAPLPETLVGAYAGAPVVLVTVDTFRADRLGAAGVGGSLTPNLDAFARDAIRFDAAIAQVPLTLPSHTTILTGQHPARHGVRTNDGFAVRPGTETLATAFSRAGYRAGAFIGAYPLHSRFGLAAGFTEYDDRFLDPEGSTPINERPAAAVVDAALAWLERTHRPAPVFVWLHVFDPHTPYTPPPPYAEQYRDRPYDGEIASTDAALGRLFSRLRDAGLFDRAVLVVVGDHGEGLGDHGERTHGMFVYDTTVHVPLLLRLPGGAGGGRHVADVVETADLAPTLAALTGVALQGPVDGRSLVPRLQPGTNPEDRAAYAETYYQSVLLGWSPLRAVRTRRWKFIEAPRPELYDLDDDGGEKRNVAIERPTQAETLRGQLPAEEAPDDAPAPGRVAAADAERLRSLGYVAGRTRATGGPLVDPKDRVEVWSRIEDAIDRMARDAAGAERLLRDAIARDTANGMAYKYLGDALARQGRLEDAVSEYRQAIDHGFEHADTFLNLGTYLRQLGREREALQALEAGVALDPSAVEAWNQLGILRARAGDRNGARTAFTRVVDLAPVRAEPYYNLAVLARDDRRLDEATALVRKAIERNPHYLEALVEQGHLALAGGRATDALASYRAALAERPDDPEALYSAGRAAVATGASADAAAFFTRFLAVAPQELASQRAAAARELTRLRK